MYLFLFGLASVAWAQNPMDFLPDLCPTLLPHCLKKMGASDPSKGMVAYIEDDLGESALGDKIWKAVKKITKCIKKGKPGHKMSDEVPAPDHEMGDDASCPAVMAMISMYVFDKPVNKGDIWCTNVCSSVMDKCLADLGKERHQLNPLDKGTYDECVWGGSKDVEGCCECLYSCPDMSEGEAKQICSDASLDECKGALKPHYGSCRRSGSKCKLKNFWKNKCESLKRRQCSMAKDAGACGNTQMNTKKKGTGGFNCVERTKMSL